MKSVGRLFLGALMLAGAAVAATPAAQAQWFSYGYSSGRVGPGVHFSLGFGPGWTTGRWVHGWHGPRYGWWWTVGNDWYYYPRPVYPYPAYMPPRFEGYYDYGRADPGYGPQAGPGYGPEYADPNPQRPEYWYFCRNPEGYYPYVQNCDDWQEELAQGGPPPGDYPEYQDPDFQREP
jgi:hypothetical protein